MKDCIVKKTVKNAVNSVVELAGTIVGFTIVPFILAKWRIDDFIDSHKQAKQD